MQQPVAHLFGLAKSQLRQFSSVGQAGGLDLDRIRADLGFMPVSAKHIFHKSCHERVMLGLPSKVRLTFLAVCGVRGHRS